MTKPFSVHEFVKVARKLVLMAATHPLKFDFDTIPIHVGFHILSVNPSGAIHKLNGVIHYSMVTNIWETSNLIVKTASRAEESPEQNEIGLSRRRERDTARREQQRVQQHQRRESETPWGKQR